MRTHVEPPLLVCQTLNRIQLVEARVAVQETLEAVDAGDTWCKEGLDVSAAGTA